MTTDHLTDRIPVQVACLPPPPGRPTRPHADPHVRGGARRGMAPEPVFVPATGRPRLHAGLAALVLRDERLQLLGPTHAGMVRQLAAGLGRGRPQRARHELHVRAESGINLMWNNAVFASAPISMHRSTETIGVVHTYRDPAHDAIIGPVGEHDVPAVATVATPGCLRAWLGGLSVRLLDAGDRGDRSRAQASTPPSVAHVASAARAIRS